jgi:hypothetical protein
MKKCPYCNSEYPDSYFECPIDRTSLDVERKRSNNKASSLGPSGYRIVFFGVPLLFFALLLVIVMRHGLGQILYKYFPKRHVIPVGIICWAISLMLLYWYFWFGPGK